MAELGGEAALALDRFLGHLSSRNASPRTVVEYRRHAAEFLAFLERAGVPWSEPDRATVRRYLASLAEVTAYGSADSTVRSAEIDGMKK